MHNFTPGKWFVEAPCLEHPYTAISSQHGLICMICRRNTQDEKRHNAMLIAQCPEMCEVLEQIDAGGMCKDKAMRKRIRAILERVRPKKEI